MWGEFDLLERDCLLQFHIDKSAPDTFVVGKAVGFFDDFFLVQKVSPRGEWDGFGLYPNSDLVAVSQDAEFWACWQGFWSERTKLHHLFQSWQRRG